MLVYKNEGTKEFADCDEMRDEINRCNAGNKRAEKVYERFMTLWFVLCAAVLGATLVSGFSSGSAGVLLIFVVYAAWIIAVQLKVAHGEEFHWSFNNKERSYRDGWGEYATKLYLGRLFGMSLVHIIVAIIMMWCASNVRTNIWSDDLAYDKEAKEFAAVGTVDWLPGDRYTIVFTDLACDGETTRMSLDPNQDGTAEYIVNAASYNAKISAADWQKYVARKVAEGDTRGKWNFCDEVYLGLRGSFRAAVGKIEGSSESDFTRLMNQETATAFVSTLATKFFAESELALEINFNLKGVEIPFN